MNLNILHKSQTSAPRPARGVARLIGRGLGTAALAAAGLAAVAPASAPASAAPVTSPAANPAANPAPAARRRASRGTNIISNSNFGSGRQGWVGSGARTSFEVTAHGYGRTSGAELRTARTGSVTLSTTRATSSLDLRAGDRYTGTALIRTTQPGSRGTLATQARSVSGAVVSRSRSFTLRDRRWHRVSTTFTATGAGTALRLQIRVGALRPGHRVFVDDARLWTGQVSTLLSAKFNSLPTGRISPGNFIRSVGGDQKSTAPYDDTSVQADTRGGGKVLRTTLQANTIHSSPSGNNGIVVFPALRRKVEQACISYDIRFGRNFDWSLGGKLPGLLGVAPGVAPSLPAGGNSPGDKGWSARLMWLGPKAYSWAGPTNMAVSYMYGPAQVSRYGDNLQWRKAFKAGRWHSLRQCHQMNTPGVRNGLLQAWLDGRRVVNRTNYLYRTRSDVAINYLSWSIFRGGSDMSWAGSHTDQIDIDNLTVTAR